MSTESTKHTLIIAFTVTIISSILVSGAVVALKPLQDNNKEIEKKKNVLLASGIYDEKSDIKEQFSRFKPLVIELESGLPTDQYNPETFDPAQLASKNDTSRWLSKEEDLAGLHRISRFQLVYLLQEEGKLKSVILPVSGKGLWSTIKGYLVLSSDLQTITGITFYEHGETPGLGGEIENPKWKSLWPGKKLYDEKGQLKFEVIKGSVDPASAGAEFKVDGISGATLTGRGVGNLVRFWLGDSGYRKFLVAMAAQKNQAGQEELKK